MTHFLFMYHILTSTDEQQQRKHQCVLMPESGVCRWHLYESRIAETKQNTCVLPFLKHRMIPCAWTIIRISIRNSDQQRISISPNSLFSLQTFSHLPFFHRSNQYWFRFLLHLFYFCCCLAWMLFYLFLLSVQVSCIFSVWLNVWFQVLTPSSNMNHIFARCFTAFLFLTFL